MLFMKILLVISTMFFCVQVSAAQWSTTHASYLMGNGYQTPGINEDISYDIITLEHVSGWEYGDNFFFTDISDLDSAAVSIYTEWAPRLSSSKILGIQYGEVLTDILLASQINIASGVSRVDLIGFGIDLKLPYFKFFNANFYSRNDKAIDGTAFQITLAWEMRFNLGFEFKFAGFFDYIGEEGEGSYVKEKNILTQPQLLWMAKKNLGIGIEYQYWKNKYGIDGLNESFPQLMVNWIF